MAADNELKVQVTLDLDKLKEQIANAEGTAEAAGKRMGGSVGGGIESKLSSLFGGIQGKIVGLAVAVAGAFTLKKMIEEASEAESALAGFNAALASAGNFSDEASAHFQNYAAHLQSITTVSDDLIIKNAALLASIGKLKGEGLDRATKAAIDFAAGAKIDVETAFRLMSKAADGHVDALKRYGVSVVKTGDDAKDFSRALDKVNQMFGGAAAAQVHTFGGAMSQLGNNFNDVLENLGKMITQSPVVIAILNKVSEGFSRAAKAIEAFATDKGDFFGNIIKQAAAFSAQWTPYVVAPLELAYNLAKSFALAFVTGLGAIVTGLATIQVAIIDYLEKPLIDFAGNVLGKIVGFFDKDLGAAIQNFARQSTEAMSGTWHTIQDQAANATTALAGKFNESATQIFDFSATQAAENFAIKTDEFIQNVGPRVKQKFKNMAEETAGAFEQSWDMIVNGFNSAFSMAELRSEKFRQTMQSKVNAAFTQFRDGAINSISSIGAALVRHENVWQAFGKALLGVFGDLAIQLGSFYMLMGLGNLFINPAAAAAQIAAGAGLLILGGALKAMAGGGAGASGAGSSSGGGVAAGSGGLASPTQDNGQGFKTAEQSKPMTSVQVNIHGNVLDRRETGIAIADTINEAFGTNGVTFAQGAAQ